MERKALHHFEEMLVELELVRLDYGFSIEQLNKVALSFDLQDGHISLSTCYSPIFLKLIS